MLNNINYNDFNHFVNLKGRRPYIYIHHAEWLLIFSITSQEKARYPHKFKLELDCDCLDSDQYENSLVNLNTKILIPRSKLPIVAKKYGISLDRFHSCLKPVAIKGVINRSRTVLKWWKKKLNHSSSK